MKDEDREPGTAPNSGYGRIPFKQVHNYRVRQRGSVSETFERRKISQLRMVTETMNAAEFQDALDKLGLDRNYVGEWLGLSNRQGRRFAAGDREVPLMLTKLLTLMLRLGLKPGQV